MDVTEVAAAVDRARGGDREGLAQLYQTFGPRVLGLCRHLLGSAAAAEDARSEVFARLPRAIDRYDATLPFDRWLLSVTSHHCLDVLRRRRLESRLFLPESEEAQALAAGAPEASPLTAVLLREGQDRVRAALTSLPDRYRIVLVLRYYGDLGYEEIATQLGLTRNHVAILIFRGKQALRRLLSEEHERA